ncbi:hypothetical protein NDU88_005921 [Pleurodeles waltl]|uniref:Uncharacterized protein n=1 Tax=Pleurodeles waltl TaxID=8319 RepID=A0AAV7MAS1_PLEWA|nr:hypothetical protein NDU88_005921 [Pleurodeles waltl]
MNRVVQEPVQIPGIGEEMMAGQCSSENLYSAQRENRELQVFQEQIRILAIEEDPIARRDSDENLLSTQGDNQEFQARAHSAAASEETKGH